MAAKMINIMIVDDHPLVLEGLTSRLGSSSKIKIVARAVNGEKALERLGEIDIDVMLMDINMPVLNGIETAEIVKEKYPNVKVIALTMHDDREYVLNMARLGVKGYILKSSPAKQMLAAIDAVYNDGVYYSPEIAGILLETIDSSFDEGLTSREQSVLRLLSSGLSNKQMARKLDISVRTVETHRRNIKAKLDISTTPGLVRYAIDHGLTS